MSLTPRFVDRSIPAARFGPELFRCGESRPEPLGSGTARVIGELDLPDVGGLKTLRAASDFEFHLVAFTQALEALRADRAVVDEHVLAAVLRDEAVALRVVEPLHRSLWHFVRPLLGVFKAPASPAAMAGSPSGIGRQNKNAARVRLRAALDYVNRSLPTSSTKT